MWIWKQLNKSEADELYLKYQDNKYFKHMSKSDAMEMILDSGHFFSTEFTNVYEIEEFTSLAANIPTNLKDTGFSYLTIPCLVLEGSLYHDFSYVNGAQNVKGEILAPYLTYYTPFAYGSSTIVPRIYTSKGCNGLIVNPKLFTQIAMRNPSMYSTVLEDRERLIELMLKHMPIQYHSVPSQRIARYCWRKSPVTGRAKFIR